MIAVCSAILARVASMSLTELLVLLARLVVRLGSDLDLGVESSICCLDLPGLLPLVGRRRRESRDSSAEQEYEDEKDGDRCASANTQSATSW
jgi:hypothetical protein